MRPAFLPLFAVLLAGLVPPPAAAEPDRVFGESVDVRVVNLEVVVTDRQGNPVAGLAPGDFELRIDGKPVPIEYFSEIVESRVAAPPSPAALAGADVSTPAPAPISGATEEGLVGRSILVFVDDFFTVEAHRDFVLHQVRNTVDQLGPADRIAIVSFDGRDLDLVTGWTGDPAQITAAIDRLAGIRPRGLERLADLQRFDLESRRLGRGLIQESDRSIIEQYVSQITRDVEKVTRAATSALRTFSDAEGRKVAVLIAGGWPRDPTFFATGSDTRLDLRSYDLRVARALGDLTATANLVGFTLYPVDAPGFQSRVADAGQLGDDRIPDLQVGAPTDTFSSGPPGEPVEVIATGDPDGMSFPSLLGPFAREESREATLLKLAQETGGTALINGERLDALGATLADTASYYWLGFSPQRQRDDEDHDIDVRVNRPGLKVRARTGFRDLSRSAEVTMQVESQLLFTSTFADDPLEIRVGDIDRSRRRWTVPLEVVIPMDRVVMVPTAEGYEARLELRVASVDEEGDRSEMPVVPVALGGAAPAPPGSHAVYETTLKLRAKGQRLVVSLYDLVGEEILSALVEL